MKVNPLQQALDKLHFLFENGWDVANLHSRNADEPQMLVQISASDLIAAAVEAALATCQVFIDNQEKLSNGSLLNRTEAAEYLGCTRQTLHNYENSGVVVPIRISGQPYYRKDDLDNVNSRQHRPFKSEGNEEVRTTKGAKKGGNRYGIKQC